MANTPPLTLILTNDVEEVKDLVSRGFCPVECSIGGESIVDSLEMDHHGSRSHLEPVSSRSYRDHFGARAEDPRFVCVGVADADATFTVAALAGLLPHPSRAEEFASAPPPVRASMTRDLQDLADTVGRVDLNPIGLDIPSLEGGDLLLTWNAMTASSRDSLGFSAGVGLWVSLTTGNPRQLAPFFGAAKEAEASRRADSLLDLEERAVEIDGVLVIKGSRTFGFPEWYGRREAAGKSEEVTGWKHPVVIALTEKFGNATIGAPNAEVAEAIFGPGGLKNVFSQLQPEGWGGREAVGGSPRGAKMTWEQVEEAAKVVASLMMKD